MSTLKTNNIQHVDRSDPSIIINTDGSVNIAGTMTYEDVTNVDSVGIITGRELINAQKQVLVGTGVSVKAGGLNVTAGITTVQALQATTGTFSGNITANGNIVGDNSTNISGINSVTSTTYYGDGSNLSNIVSTTINNNAANRIITGSGSANTLNGNTYATWNGSNLGLRGGEGADCSIELASDEGDDNSDFWRVMAQASDNALAIDHYTTGSWVEQLRINSNGKIGVNVTPSTGQFVVKNSDDSNLNVLSVLNDNGNESGGFSQASDGDGTIFAKKNDGTLNVFLRSDGVSYVKGGDFGVGTDSPSTKLDVVDDSASGYIAEFRQSNTSNSGQIIIDSPTDGDSRPVLIDMARAGTVKWSIGQGYNSSGGAFHISNGTLQSGVSNVKASFLTGGGLTFNGDTAAANALDDYEEGTWTPTFSSSGATWTYNHQSGTYTKVGDTVHVWFYVTLHPSISPSGTSTNVITLPLPFTATGVTRYEAGVAFGMQYKINMTGYGNVLGKVYQSTNYISLTYAEDDGAGGSYSSNRFDATGCGLSGTVTYKVA